MERVHGRRGRRRGKRAIAVLVSKPSREALEADLAARGIDLYQQQFWQVRGQVRALLRDPTSELAIEANHGAGISVPSLLYLVVDALEGANWQRTGKKSGRPKRLHQRLSDAARRQGVAERAELTTEQLLELARADPKLQDHEREMLNDE